jgi:hypothetical protein
MLREGEVEEPFKLMQREKAVVPEASSSIYVIKPNIKLCFECIPCLPLNVDSRAGHSWRISSL